MTEQKIPYSSLDTPAVLVDMDKLEANIREMSQLAAEAGVSLRPHVKVHECAAIAKMQIEAGACGIEVGPVGQAEAMAEEGLDDIVIAHPSFYSGPKGEILKKLLNKPGIRIAVVVDMVEQAEGVSKVGEAVRRKVPVLMKLDTGGNRYGVLPGESILNMAKKLRQLPGIKFVGIYAHTWKVDGGKATVESVNEMAFGEGRIVAEAVKMLKKGGITAEVVTVGASATFRSTCRYMKEGKFPEITEIHPGQCVIGDIMYMRSGGNTREACAVTVLTTVVSTSHPDFAIIDAGYKAFGFDPLIGYRDTQGFFWQGQPSYGSVQKRPDLWLGAMGAETGWVFYKDLKKKLCLGERLEIVPNNATLVINIHDQMYGVRNSVVERVIPVTGRGRGN